MSSDIRKKLEEEISVLEKELREELPRALKTAAALGDLSENADYSAARERQDFVRVRLGQLKQRAAELSMINFEKIPRDRISLGSKVVVLDVDKDEKVTFTLVTTEDANAPLGLISTTSPIGKASPSRNMIPSRSSAADRRMTSASRLSFVAWSRIGSQEE